MESITFELIFRTPWVIKIFFGGGEAKNKNHEPWQDGNFYYIAGYTSAGVPYGITWDEYKDEYRDDSQDSEIEFALEHISSNLKSCKL